MQFVETIENTVEETTTLNGMKAYTSSLSSAVDLFYKIGAMRGQDVIPAFAKAYAEDRDVAIRIALWARDIRGGAGERQLFRDILTYLGKTDPAAFLNTRLLETTAEVGRWDDITYTLGEAVADSVKNRALAVILEGLGDPSVARLCAKWMPRKGPIALMIRNYAGWSPKRYRKTLVGRTNVVETQMCANEWDEIEYSHVPSVASQVYRKAFLRRTPERYREYLDGLKTGATKVNAAAVYPYQVLKMVWNGQYHNVLASAEDVALANAQWDALPDYMGDNSVLPIVDVSGSMSICIDCKSSVSALDVAVSLGLYCSSKNKGKFANVIFPFSDDCKPVITKGTLAERASQLTRGGWCGSTNLEGVVDKVLEIAKRGNVPQEEMPKQLLIMSDMQFNCAVDVRNSRSLSAMEMIRSRYKAAGYQPPVIVFWNLVAYGNMPAAKDENGIAMVSGFSPAIMKSILAAKEFTPQLIMLDTVGVDRYNIWK